MEKEITLKFNNCISNDPCKICGGRCDPNGFDYFIKGTSSLVCKQCAEKRAPDLVEIRKAAFIFAAEMLATYQEKAKPERRQTSPAEKLANRIKNARKTDAKLAGMFGTNRTYVSIANKLVREAPDLSIKVRAGEMTIPQAKRELERRKAETWLESTI